MQQRDHLVLCRLEEGMPDVPEPKLRALVLVTSTYIHTHSYAKVLFTGPEHPPYPVTKTLLMTHKLPAMMPTHAGCQITLQQKTALNMLRAHLYMMSRVSPLGVE